MHDLTENENLLKYIGAISTIRGESATVNSRCLSVKIQFSSLTQRPENLVNISGITEKSGNLCEVPIDKCGFEVDEHQIDGTGTENKSVFKPSLPTLWDLWMTRSSIEALFESSTRF